MMQLTNQPFHMKSHENFVHLGKFYGSHPLALKVSCSLVLHENLKAD